MGLNPSQEVWKTPAPGLVPGELRGLPAMLGSTGPGRAGVHLIRNSPSGKTLLVLPEMPPVQTWLNTGRLPPMPAIFFTLADF